MAPRERSILIKVTPKSGGAIGVGGVSPKRILATIIIWDHVITFFAKQDNFWVENILSIDVHFDAMHTKRKGWIALDIDGTITDQVYEIPENVTSFLTEKASEGWQIAFATGRTFRFAMMALSHLKFPFIMIPQNGAAALSMPEEKFFFTRTLPFEMIDCIQKYFASSGLDFVIYLGPEMKDRCYFRPKKLSEETLAKIERWQKIQKEAWHPVEKYSKEDFHEFAAAKAYGATGTIQELKKKLEEDGRFCVTIVKDPIVAGWSILFITHPLASKGGALKELFSRLGRGEKVIAAGDDENDLSLLSVADIKIAMSHAPTALLKIADLIAYKEEEKGIVPTLQRAIDG